jgi:hypothetical protein
MGKGIRKHFGVFSKAPSYKTATNPRITCSIPLAIDPFAIAIATAKQAKPARLTDRRREPAAGYEIHGGKQNWVLDPEHSRQFGLNRHRCILSFD